jgi:hypothetical protein
MKPRRVLIPLAVAKLGSTKWRDPRWLGPAVAIRGTSHDCRLVLDALVAIGNPTCERLDAARVIPGGLFTSAGIARRVARVANTGTLPGAVRS